MIRILMRVLRLTRRRSNRNMIACKISILVAILSHNMRSRCSEEFSDLKRLCKICSVVSERLVRPLQLR